MANTSVNSLMVDPGNVFFYTNAWANVMVEDYITWLRTTSLIENKLVSDTDRYRYEADFYGYLRDVCKITNPAYRQLLLRLNNMHHPSEFGAGFGVVTVVKTAYIDTMIQMMLTYWGKR